MSFNHKIPFPVQIRKVSKVIQDQGFYFQVKLKKSVNLFLSILSFTICIIQDWYKPQALDVDSLFLSNVTLSHLQRLLVCMQAAVSCLKDLAVES